MTEAGLLLPLLLGPASIFALAALAELIWPRRVLRFGRAWRWSTGALLFVGNRATIRLLSLLVTLPAAALWAESEGIGLLRLVDLPIWVEVGLAFVLLDFAMWLQHLLMHRVPILWRMHKVHHADPDLDVSTAIRFHPFEIAVSLLWKAAWVILLGAPAFVILAFEAWLTANAAFNHGNIELPPRLDRWLRRLLVTPDMHLVHHSTEINEQQSNYGFALSLWDRLFGTYAIESKNGRDRQAIGLAELQDSQPTRILHALRLPLT